MKKDFIACMSLPRAMEKDIIACMSSMHAMEKEIIVVFIFPNAVPKDSKGRRNEVRATIDLRRRWEKRKQAT